MANIIAGSTHDFKRTEGLDGSLWDLTGAAATLFMRDAAGTLLEFAGSVLDGPAGVVHYVQSDPDVFSNELAGTWQRWWVIAKGGIVDVTPPISFQVVAVP